MRACGEVREEDGRQPRTVPLVGDREGDLARPGSTGAPKTAWPTILCSSPATATSPNPPAGTTSTAQAAARSMLAPPEKKRNQRERSDRPLNRSRRAGSSSATTGRMRTVEPSRSATSASSSLSAAHAGVPGPSRGAGRRGGGRARRPGRRGSPRAPDRCAPPRDGRPEISSSGSQFAPSRAAIAAVASDTRPGARSRARARAMRTPPAPRTRRPRTACRPPPARRGTHRGRGRGGMSRRPPRRHAPGARRPRGVELSIRALAGRGGIGVVGGPLARRQADELLADDVGGQDGQTAALGEGRGERDFPAAGAPQSTTGRRGMRARQGESGWRPRPAVPPPRAASLRSGSVAKSWSARIAATFARTRARGGEEGDERVVAGIAARVAVAHTRCPARSARARRRAPSPGTRGRPTTSMRSAGSNSRQSTISMPSRRRTCSARRSPWPSRTWPCRARRAGAPPGRGKALAVRSAAASARRSRRPPATASSVWRSRPARAGTAARRRPTSTPAAPRRGRRPAARRRGGSRRASTLVVARRRVQRRLLVVAAHLDGVLDGLGRLGRGERMARRRGTTARTPR